MLKSISAFMLLVGILSSGCSHTGETVTNTETPPVEVSTRTTAVHAVVVGMEYSKFAGACPGAALDSRRMYALLSKYATSVILLQNENATHFAVKDAIQTAIERSGTGLFILYYSGHGGSDPFPDTGIEETDGKDEYLCLYDRYMRDNEIWSMISKAKGRVLIITDSCHSQSQFRCGKFMLYPPLGFDHTLNESHSFSLLCWSGCPDSDYSYGSSTGGQFTNAILRYFSPRMTYQELWGKIKADKTLRAYQNPQSTVIGSGFDNALIFR